MTVDVKNVHFSYGSHTVLQGIDFAADAGQVVALLGANGAGKSTLLRCMLGFLKSYSGDILLCGQDARTVSRQTLSRLAAYIPQYSVPIYNYTVYDTVLMGTCGMLNPLQRPGTYHRELASAMLEKLGIAHLRDCGINEISGGEQQLCRIARAMTQQAKILIMDEPTANLDYGNQYRVLSTLRQLAQDGYTVLYSTHNPEQAGYFATHVLALRDGKVFAHGEARQTVTRELIEALYHIPAEMWGRTGEENR